MDRRDLFSPLRNLLTDLGAKQPDYEALTFSDLVLDRRTLLTACGLAVIQAQPTTPESIVEASRPPAPKFLHLGATTAPVLEQGADLDRIERRRTFYIKQFEKELHQGADLKIAKTESGEYAIVFIDDVSNRRHRSARGGAHHAFDAFPSQKVDLCHHIELGRSKDFAELHDKLPDAAKIVVRGSELSIERHHGEFSLLWKVYAREPEAKTRADALEDNLCRAGFSNRLVCDRTTEPVRDGHVNGHNRELPDRAALEAIKRKFAGPVVAAVQEETIRGIDTLQRQLTQIEKSSFEGTSFSPDMIFDPAPEVIIEDLLKKNFNLQVYRAMSESVASEHGARMTAMENASNNARDMINKLTLTYNKARQEKITTELIEIVSGAESLKG